MQPRSDVPLAAHTMFRSVDLDEARERVARVFCDHRLETIGRTRLDARHNHFAGERLVRAVVGCASEDDRERTGAGGPCHTRGEQGPVAHG